MKEEEWNEIRIDTIGQNGNDGEHYDKAKNNGGDTDYYQLKPDWKDAMDIVEDREMNYAQGNILKVAITFNIGRHEGTDYERELNKIIFFAKREIKRITNEKEIIVKTRTASRLSKDSD